MNQVENNNKTYPGLFKDLLNRRVPQLVGFYLAGSWGILQFFDWIVGRYLLSPLLVDLALTIIGALLPSIFILAYCHGSPGKNKWHKAEKFLVPLNLLITVILVFTLFNHKNLDSIARRVAVTDESGKIIEKVVPKSSSIKELAIFDIENLTGDKKLDWLKSGFIQMLELDLFQDPFMNIKSPYINAPLSGFYVYRKFKDAGYEDVSKAPVMLQKKIANELNTHAFLSGSINKKNNILELSINLYSTKNSKILSKKIFKGTSVFSLIDEVSVFLKKTFKLPSYKNDEIIDLQIKDMYTSSEKAAKLVTQAGSGIVKNNDWKKAQKYYEEAIIEDKTFALAYIGLAEIYAMNNKTDKWKATYKPLMKYIYKLPDKLQFYIKAGYYIAIKGEPEKAFDLFRMIIKLNPTDVNAYFTLATRLDMTGNYDEAIVYYKKTLELDPGKFEIYNTIGKAYENKSDLKNAINYFKLYSEKFPKKPNGFLKIGIVEEKLGNFSEARKYYEKALLLEPEKISTIAIIAGLDINLGNYKVALETYRELLKSVTEPRKLAKIYANLSGYYKLRGQLLKEMEYIDLMLDEYKKFKAPLHVTITKIVMVGVYLKNGKHDQVRKMLTSFEKDLGAPFDKLVSIGYIKYYKNRGELDKVEKQILDLEDFIKKMGTKQFIVIASKARGDVFRLKGNYKEAISHYRKVVKLKQDNTSVLKNIALCFLKDGNVEESTKFINRAIKISPYDPEICYGAAQIYFAQKNMESGLEYLNRAIKVWEDADANFIPAKEAKELLSKYSKEE